MKKTLRVLLVLFGLMLISGVGTYVWATIRSARLGARTVETHSVDFPIPYPLSADEVAALPPGTDPDAVALERAIERGRHLVSARYVCGECHGQSYGGGVMVDDPMLGTFLGPNITLGEGSKTLDYRPSDWDRAVRHGVKPNGAPSVMPAEDFQLMSDQELSDVIAYIRSLPPVDNTVPEVRLGPVGRVLLSVGQLRFSSDLIARHDASHPALPPAAEVSVEFGGHLAGICVGCHRDDLAGGPIMGGDPSWPAARNLTPHVDGLAGWSYADFRRVLLEARRPDGTEVREPMSLIGPYAENMTDVEMEALWAYLRSIPAVPSRD